MKEIQGWHQLIGMAGRSLLLFALVLLTGCALPQVSAESRIFLPLKAELLDVAILPKQTFAETVVGGLSAITYDINRDVFYALSDDRGSLAPPRFYTLKIATNTGAANPTIQSVQVTNVTFLKDAEGQVYESGRLDAEGMRLSPRSSLFISSEGVAATNSPPSLNEYDLETGMLKTAFRLPERFLSAESTDAEIFVDPAEAPQGIRDNQGFEALALSATSLDGEREPFRLFMATESALGQDFSDDPTVPLNSRFLHYLIGPGQSTLISEHAYPLSLEPMGAVSNGLSELLTVDRGGHFLALERVFGIRGFEIKLFQIATGSATDISTLARLSSLEGINPIRKQLLLDFATLDLPVDAIDNLEGMTLGPPLPDGSASLWMISDDNFTDEQTTQIWLLRLTQQ